MGMSTENRSYNIWHIDNVMKLFFLFKKNNNKNNILESDLESTITTYPVL